MKIALISSTHLATPPLKYGGVELVVSNLAEELCKQGHEVIVLASGDSTTTAPIHSIQDISTRIETEPVDPELELSLDFLSTIEAVKYLSENNFDIIHNHAEWLVLPFKDSLKGKLITTIHCNYSQDAIVRGSMLMKFKDLPFVSLSDNHRLQLPELNYVDTVYNGINVDNYEFNAEPDNYLFFLGRIAPVKNPVQAIKIALKTNRRLLIAATIANADDEHYYKTEVAPLVDGDQIQFLGEVGLADKVKLLKNAAALVNPVAWDEPFGLVNIEAMACGTPVICSDNGALPEIVTKETGFVCSSFEEMCEAVELINRIDRIDCFNLIQKKFSSKIMAENYLKVYEEILQ